MDLQYISSYWYVYTHKKEKRPNNNIGEYNQLILTICSLDQK